ncbi:ImmA/IrrE family metallo-endopeptidase [Corynebacterium argentoratense]|uniref:ImmA/IrrE family metallo-endopeptidase n=1 Tax=Corynebacterium argentoratense TaxID=42817 RepID=UPI00248EE902|nr:ImmA/IrrE family metallo-endopeptidase [Corynebacterium argentoratense]
MSSVEAKLDALAQDMGITVIETSKLGSSLNACFHPSTRTVFVRLGLDPVTRTCAIAHELGHAHYGHSCSTQRAEREADEWAACKLLKIDEVEAAGWECDGARSAMSAELGVTPGLLDLWMSMYEQGRIKNHHEWCTIN